MDINTLPAPPTAGRTDLPAPPSAQASAGRADLPAPPSAASAASGALRTDLPAPPGPSAPSAAELREQNRITPEEIHAIAAKHGANADSVSAWTPFIAGAYTAPNAGPSDIHSAGDLGQAVMQGAEHAGHDVSEALLGAPAWLAKQSLDSKDRAAMDEVSALAAERRSGIRKVAETAGELAIGIGVGNFAGAVAKGAGVAAAQAAPTVTHAAVMGLATGAAQGFFGAKEGEGLQGAATGAVIGGIGGVVLHGVMSGALASARQVLGQVGRGVEAQNAQALQVGLTAVREEVEAHMASPEFKQHLETSWGPIQGAVAASPEEAVLPRFGDGTRGGRDLIEFSSYIKNPAVQPVPASAPTEEAAAAALQHIRSTGLPPEQLQNLWSNLQQVELVADAKLTHIGAGLNVSESTTFGRIGRALLRARAELGIIDDRTGGITQFTSASDDVAVAHAKYGNDFASLSGASLGMLKRQMAAGNTSWDAGTLRAVEHSSDLAASALSPEAKAATIELDGWYAKMRDYVNGVAGSEFIKSVAGNVERYRPRMQLDAEQTALAVRKSVRDVETESGVRLLGGPVNERQMANLDSSSGGAWEQLKVQLKYLHGAEADTPEALQQQLIQATDATRSEALTNARLSRRAPSVALMRSADDSTIPDSLRETNQVTLAGNWLRTSLQAAHMQESFSGMQRETAKAAALGDQAGVEYAAKMLQSLAGTDRGTVPKAFQNLRTRYQTGLADAAARASEAGNEPAASGLTFLRNLGDVPTTLMSSMYPNMVGLKFSTAFKSITAPWTATMPELMGAGGGWGMGKMASAAATVAQRMANPANWSGVMQEMHEAGHLPNQLGRAEMDFLRTGLEQGALSRGVRKSIDVWTKAVMYPLGMAEAAGRLMAKAAGSSISKELLEGNPSALSYLEQMGAGDRATAQSLLREAKNRAPGAEAELEKRMQTFLIAKTLHMYSPTQMSELGRSFGPIVSAFGTWPTAVAGDIARDYINKGALGGSTALFRKYMAPLMALTYMQHVASAGGWDPTTNPQMRALTGSSGLVGASPLPEAAKSLVPGKSPIVQSVTEGVTAIGSMDPAKMWAALNKAGETYAPFAGLVPLADTTIAGLAGHERPEKGTTLTGRAMNLVSPGSGTRLDEAIKARFGREGK